MRCPEASEVFSPYLDGELTQEEGRALQAHLSSCVACRHGVEQLRSDLARLQALPRRPLPAHLWARVQRQVEGAPRSWRGAGASPRPLRPGRGPWRASLVAAAVLWLCLGGLALLGIDSEEPPDPGMAARALDRHGAFLDDPLQGEAPLWTTASYRVDLSGAARGRGGIR